MMIGVNSKYLFSYFFIGCLFKFFFSRLLYPLCSLLSALHYLSSLFLISSHFLFLSSESTFLSTVIASKRSLLMMAFFRSFKSLFYLILLYLNSTSSFLFCVFFSSQVSHSQNIAGRSKYHSFSLVLFIVYHSAPQTLFSNSTLNPVIQQSSNL